MKANTRNMPRPNRIYDTDTVIIVDTETTGLYGYPHDLVLEIGAVAVDLETREVEDIYDQVIGYDIDAMTTQQRNCMVYTDPSFNDLSVKDTIKAHKNGKDLDTVVEEFRDTVYDIFDGGMPHMTAYNAPFDFGKFLNYDPWGWIDGDNYIEMPCLMDKATYVCKIRNRYGYKWPKVDEAINHMFSPRERREYDLHKEKHRALDDARLEANIMLKMIDMGSYTI